MDWISNLFVALLLTDLSGTLFFVIGILFRKIWFKNDVRLLRFAVFVTLCAFIVPSVYYVLHIDRRLDRYVHSSINLFYSTPRISEVFAFLGWLWVAMFLGLLTYKLFCRWRWAYTCRGNIPEEDPEIERCFTEICAELGIEGKVSLSRNDSVDIPCITYHHGMVVILPLNVYTKEEAEVIFYHELCHYLEKDMFFKTFCVVITLLHVFNPVTHVMLKQLILFCEMSCDKMACEKARGRFSTHQYFQVIFDMLLTEGTRDRYQLFALVDTRSDYERRVAFMNEYGKHGGMKKSMALVLALCFLMGSNFTSLAAGAGVADLYEGVAEATSEINVLKDMDNNVDENRKAAEELARTYNLDLEDIVMMDNTGIETYGRVKYIDWNVRAGKTYMSTGFSEIAGSEATILVAGDPKDITFLAGLKDPNNIMNCVKGSDIVDYTFTIEIQGRYYFFVINLSEEEDLQINAMITKY